MSGETIRDVIVRLKLEQQATKLRVPDTAPVQRQLQTVERASLETSRKIADPYKTLSAELDKIHAAHVKAGQEAKAFQEKATTAAFEAGDKFKSAGEGAFTLARGLTLLSASGDEDMQRLVQSIAMVQGAFDTFKGGFELVKGLSEGYRAWTARTVALAAAQRTAAATGGLVAVANGAVATTAGAAALAEGAVTKANGAVAVSNGVVVNSNNAVTASYVARAAAAKAAAVAGSVGVAGVAAIAAGVMFAGKVVSDRIIAGWEEDARREFEQKKAATILNYKRQVEGARAEFLQSMERLADRQSELFERNDDLRGLETDQKRLSVAQQILAVETERTRVRESLDRDVPGGEIFTGFTFGVGRGADAKGGIQQLIDQGDSAIIPDLERAKSIVERINADEQRDISLQREKLGLIREQVTERQRYVAEQTRAVAELRKALEIEERRVESAQARFGRLDAQDQIEAKRIATKKSRGEELTPEEAGFIESKIGANRVTEGFFAERGKAAGADQVLFEFGGLSERGVARENTRSEMKRQLKEAESPNSKLLVESAKEEIGRLNREQEKLWGELSEAIKENGDTTVVMLRQLTDSIANIKRNMEYTQQAQQAAVN